MNEAIRRVKEQAWANMSPAERKNNVVLDTDSDEENAARLMTLHGYGEMKTTAAKSKWCRWDVEGEKEGKGVKAEVKSRTYDKPEYDTWIIDTYKIDYLLDNFPDDELYFVNVYEGMYHIYDARFVATCRKGTTMARFKDGKNELREFYYMPKDGAIMDLAQNQE